MLGLLIKTTLGVTFGCYGEHTIRAVSSYAIHERTSRTPPGVLLLAGAVSG